MYIPKEVYHLVGLAVQDHPDPYVCVRRIQHHAEKTMYHLLNSRREQEIRQYIDNLITVMNISRIEFDLIEQWHIAYSDIVDESNKRSRPSESPTTSFPHN